MLSSRPRTPEPPWDPDDPGLDETLIEVIEYIEREGELLEQLELYRQGGSVMSMCARCGIPLPAGLTLGEWVRIPLVCKYCLIEL